MATHPCRYWNYRCIFYQILPGDLYTACSRRRHTCSAYLSSTMALCSYRDRQAKRRNCLVSIWSIAFTLFLVANPIGNIPAFVAVLKDFDFQRQKKILFRESLFSYAIAIFFLFI